MMRRPLALLLSLALALPAPMPVFAYDLPDLGDVASSELSPAAERRIGEQIISQIPVGRIGEPSDIARAVGVDASKINYVAFHCKIFKFFQHSHNC